jgi:C4-dicarboxylate-specific signal transduction histidine kinase
VRHLVTLPNEPRLVTARLLLADLLEDQGDYPGAYEAYAEGSRVAAEQQREAIALRAEMLALDRDAEQVLRSTEQTLAYAQRLSNVGHLVASINHELNQPMASIRLVAETALELIDSGETAEVLASMRSMLKLSTRLTDLTAQLAAFPARSTAQVQQLSLRQAVLEALGMLRSRLGQTPCEIVIGFDDALAHGFEGQLVRVIANLVNNALDVLEPVQSRRIEFSCAADGEFIVLSVADNGPGLAPAVLERLFQPFFSTKAAGRGLGLGLALSRDVMREMGGDLLARNGNGNGNGGAVFDVRLPLEDPTTVPGTL